jgi:LysM repeat protein
LTAQLSVAANRRAHDTPAVLKLIKALIILMLLLGIAGIVVYFYYDTQLRPKREAKEEAALPPPTPPPDPALPDFNAAGKLKASGKLVEAREVLERLIDQNPQSGLVEDARNLIGEINTDLFFSTVHTPDKEVYVVKPGDALAKIQRRFKATPELIMRTNNLTDPTKLQVGQQLLIPRVEFSLLLQHADKKVVLLNHGKFFKQYKVVKWSPSAKNIPTGVKVTETAAYKDGVRVAFGTKDFAAATNRWVMMSVPAYTIYGEPGASAEKVDRPAGGIGVKPEDADELATLLSRGVPVTIE